MLTYSIKQRRVAAHTHRVDVYALLALPDEAPAMTYWQATYYAKKQPGVRYSLLHKGRYLGTFGSVDRAHTVAVHKAVAHFDRLLSERIAVYNGMRSLGGA